MKTSSTCASKQCFCLNISEMNRIESKQLLLLTRGISRYVELCIYSYLSNYKFYFLPKDWAYICYGHFVLI